MLIDPDFVPLPHLGFQGPTGTPPVLSHHLWLGFATWVGWGGPRRHSTLCDLWGFLVTPGNSHSVPVLSALPKRWGQGRSPAMLEEDKRLPSTQPHWPQGADRGHPRPRVGSPCWGPRPLPPLFAVDFLLLLVASLQWQVFVDENTASVSLQAGDNVEISWELKPADLTQLGPIPNFIFCQWDLGSWSWAPGGWAVSPPAQHRGPKNSFLWRWRYYYFLFFLIKKLNWRIICI